MCDCDSDELDFGPQPSTEKPSLTPTSFSILRRTQQASRSSTPAQSVRIMRVVAPPSLGLRYSESAVPERFDASLQLPTSANRSSLAALDKPTGFNDPFGLRDSYTSEASGFDVLNFWNVETDHDASQSQLLTPTAFQDPYQGVTVEVNNHSINNQGVVMYHVDIKGPDGILSTYTIRRRFRAFKNLHSELTRLLLEYQNARAQLDAAVAARTPYPLDGPENHIPLSPHSAAALEKAPPVSNTNYRTVTLPSLPSAGVWSYLKRHDVRLVEQRKRRFQEILRLAIRHPATKHSGVLDEFLSVAPSEISQRGSSYVSLQDYSVPVFDRQRESIERRQRKMRVLEDRRLRAGSDSQFGERAHQ
ncbi:hypothetical protein PHYPSEUDO_005665 [Phytophthora pseudosyringae]|uniref:PX domain-containing protein n=1 Tax=Phytophthora pseudosyringae TaxID=221518 RepID=A0A8T1VNY8_9STRA|nr:hypothetical protein PHYPSEUDO_005665 [Phytophthora pseudosyringae]